MSTMRRAPDVACFGEVIWDVYERGARALVREPGGASTNVAIGLARLGLRPAVVGGIGKDRFGDALAAALAAEGVDVRALVRRPERTGVTFIAVGEDREPRFLNFRQGTADGAVDASDVRGSAAARAPWIVVGSSTAAGGAVARATAAFVDEARRAGGQLAVDLNARPLLWKSARAAAASAARLVSGASLVKASEADLEALAPGGGIRWLRARAPQAACVVTRGARGATVFTRALELTVPARPARRAVDATGAGDAFLAGLLAALSAARVTPSAPAFADEAFWTEALLLGHALGRKAVGRLGATRGLVALDAARARVQSIGSRWRKTSGSNAWPSARPEARA